MSSWAALAINTPDLARVEALMLLGRSSQTGESGEVGRIPGGLLGYLQMAQASIGRFNAEVLVTTSQEERVSFCSSFYSSDLAQDFPTKDLGNRV